MGKLQNNKHCPLSATGKKVAHHSRTSLMAQVHLRYVNDQPRATILHAWIDIFRENSGFFPEFFDIFAQLFLKNSSSPVKTRICRGF